MLVVDVIMEDKENKGEVEQGNCVWFNKINYLISN